MKRLLLIITATAATALGQDYYRYIPAPDEPIWDFTARQRYYREIDDAVEAQENQQRQLDEISSRQRQLEEQIESLR